MNQGSVRFQKSDVEMLEQLETLRTITMSLFKYDDRSELIQTFGGDCTRIARAHLLLSRTKQHSAVGAPQRIAERQAAVSKCMDACRSIEQVLKDIGLGVVLRNAREDELRRSGSNRFRCFSESRSPPPGLRSHLYQTAVANQASELMQ